MTLTAVVTLACSSATSLKFARMSFQLIRTLRRTIISELPVSCHTKFLQLNFSHFLTQ
jgi:hypothetical protein